MPHSTGPPDWWQKLDDQMKRDSERSARVVGWICGFRVLPSEAFHRSKLSQGPPNKSVSRNRRRRKRRIVVTEQSKGRIAADPKSPLMICSRSVPVSDQRSEWSKWIWLIVLFVIWPELFGYIYFGFVFWICYRLLFHYFAALARIQRR